MNYNERGKYAKSNSTFCIIFPDEKKKLLKKMYCDRKHLRYPRKNNV